MSSRNPAAILIAMLIAACAAGPAEAAVFCATTADELTAALASVQQNAAANAATDEVRIRAGHYLAPDGGWHVDVHAFGGVVISGGFLDADCQTQSLDASLTVLDGHLAARPLTIDTGFLPGQPAAARQIAVSGLTIENGVGTLSGGLKISDSGPIYNGGILVERNIFAGNSGTEYQPDNSSGALIAATDGTPLIVRGNLFVGNRAPNGSAAALYSNDAIAVTGNTFSGNQATGEIPGPDPLVPHVVVTVATFAGFTYSNNVFWANNPDDIDGTFDIGAASTIFANTRAKLFNNDVQTVSGTPAIDQDNKNVDPQFADAGGGDFRLAGTSPLIDAGLDTADGGIGSVDLDGAVRLRGLHVDIGAYEFAETIFANGFD
jgi:hypothetical protein